jgi:PKD repeat protein
MLFSDCVVNNCRRLSKLGCFFCLATLANMLLGTSCGQASASRSLTMSVGTGATATTELLPTVMLKATPSSGVAPLAVIFVATCSTCVVYTWSFGDGSTGSSSEPTQSHTYQAANSYSVVVEGTDKDGNGTNATTSITVGEAADVMPKLNVAASPLSGDTPLLVKFVATCHTCVAYTWSFGDGGSQIAPGPVQKHTYQASGTYDVIVVGTDKYGHEANAQCTVTADSPGGGTSSPISLAGYTGTEMIPWPTIVPSLGNLTSNNQIVVDTSYATAGFTGTLSPIARCTDSTFEVGHPDISLSPGLGGSGDAAQLVNADSTALHLNDSGGRGLITFFNRFTLTCGQATTAADNLTNPGSASTPYNFTGGTWDWNNPQIYYGFGGNNDTTRTQAVAYTFPILPSLNFTVGPIFTDFQYGLPLGSTAPAWAPNTSYTQGQYVSYTLTPANCTATATGCDWVQNHPYPVLGTIMVPSLFNPLGCAFKLVATGTSAATEPNWNFGNTGTMCLPASQGMITDGSNKWRNLGSGPTWVFQLTSAPGTSGSVTPSFVPSSGRPDLLTLISDNGLTWTNVGPMATPAWSSYAGISRNSTRMCSAFSSNSYGYANNYTTYNADQGTGIFMACYDNVLNEYVLMNTGTGFQSVVTCSGGTGYNCSGGTWTMTPQGQVTVFGTGCGVLSHNLKQSDSMDYPVLTRQGSLIGASCTTPANNLYDWQPFAPFNSGTTLQLYNSVSDHWAMGHSTLVNVGAQTVGPPDDYTTGVFTQLLSALSPTAIPLVSWQPSCTNSYVTPSTLPPCNFSSAYDSHLSWAYNPGGADITPICGSIYNYATLATPPTLAPYQGEEVCISTFPTWTNGATPSILQTQYRFTHCFNTGGNSFFDIQFCISQVSADGQFLFFGSDWNCALGGTDGSTNPPCGPPWVAGTSYALNAYINPFSSTGGSGTNYGVWQITIPGTAASAAPSWSTCGTAVGCSLTDANGVQYTYVGVNKSRGDVFVVQLVANVQ